MNEFIFDEKEHKYFLNGKELPSVTKIIEQVLFHNKYENVNQDVLNDAAKRGQIIHSEIEDYIKRNALGFTDELYNFIILKEDNKLNDIQSELKIHNDEMAGTIDIFAIKGGKGQKKKKILADIKTTYRLDKEYVSWQLSFYAYIVEHTTEHKIDELYAIWLRDGKSKMEKVERKSDKEVEDVLEAFKNGVKINSDVATLQTIPKEVQIDFCSYMEQIKAIEEKTKEVKEAILKEMEERGISKVDLGRLTITYKAPTTKTSVDSAKLKEDGLYEKYSKKSDVKSSIMIKVKE